MICESFPNIGWSVRRSAALALVWLAMLSPPPALADPLPGQLTGTVRTREGRPEPAATVRVLGQNVALSTVTDDAGRFGFTTLALGEYDVLADKNGMQAAARIELSSGGADLRLTLLPLATIHAVVVTHPSGPPVSGSGTDLTLNQSVLTHSPASTSFPNLLLQLPGAARGANGVVHINGDHGDINYIVDGVSIPQELNREVGSEFDVSNAAFVDVLEGAYPAQYGGRFAAVINVGTRTGNGPAGYSAFVSGGSYATYDSSLAYHEPVGRGSLVLALHGGSTDDALDPPQPVPVHNQGSDASQFLRLTMPTHGADYFNFTLSHSYQTFQIPNAVDGGEPASTDDNETQNDSFASLQYRHAIGSHGMISFGPAYKRSTIRDFGDPNDDFIYGEAINITNGGTPDDCANAVKTGDFSPTTCAYSLFGDATATDLSWNADYELQSARHDVRAGVFYDVTLVPKRYAITLQPANFLAPIYSPNAPGSAYTVVDDAPNVGHIESLYLQDRWSIGSNDEVDYGLRMDAFQLFSTQLDDGASMFSPRIKLMHRFGLRASVYAYYGRFFTPFSFQNVSPPAAYLLNLPLQRSVAAFDLKPQRDSVYELGGHLPVGSGDLGLRVTQKNAGDLIDDTQVGVTAFHEDINYQLGRIATQTAYYQRSLARGGRMYASANHTYSENSGCETQLLAPCFGAPTGYTPADHEQRWGATAGAIFDDVRGGWFSVDGEYGSGLSSAACPASVAGYCKYTPHTVFDAEKGVAIGPHMAVTLRVGNVLNDRYYVTLLNAQGNHYSTGRTVVLGIAFASP
jgi:hypothetical protein